MRKAFARVTSTSLARSAHVTKRSRRPLPGSPLPVRPPPLSPLPLSRLGPPSRKEGSEGSEATTRPGPWRWAQWWRVSAKSPWSSRVNALPNSGTLGSRGARPAAVRAPAFIMKRPLEAFITRTQEKAPVFLRIHGWPLQLGERQAMRGFCRGDSAGAGVAAEPRGSRGAGCAVAQRSSEGTARRQLPLQLGERQAMRGFCRGDSAGAAVAAEPRGTRGVVWLEYPSAAASWSAAAWSADSFREARPAEREPSSSYDRQRQAQRLQAASTRDHKCAARGGAKSTARGGAKSTRGGECTRASRQGSCQGSSL